MNDRDIFVFTEEPSATPVIRHIAGMLGIGSRVRIVEHDGIGDMLRSLRLKVASDIDPNRNFLVLRDADGLDCKKLKRDLTELIPAGRRNNALIRIVCQELEAWYIAQPEALARAGVLKSKIPASILKKSPDAMTDPKKIFLKHAHRQGQMDNARKIAPHLNVESAKSESFGHVVSALKRLALMQV